MLTHAEYMKKSTIFSISSFNLEEVSSTILVQMVLFTDSEFSKLSMQHVIKETIFYKIEFIHHISTKPNKELNSVMSSMWKIK